MGSVVKSIGRVFKGIGKTLKKIAPVLLVAAAVYVGYGFATGFTGAGWPTITGWGKSLMGGVSSGSTVSQAAAQASQQVTAGTAAQTSALGTVAGTPLEVTTTPPMYGGAQAAAPSALETAAGAGTQQPGVTGGLLSSISPIGEAYAGDASVITDMGGPYSPGPDADIIAFDQSMASGVGAGSTGASGFGAGSMVSPSFNLSTLTGTGPGLESLGTRSALSNVGNVTGVAADLNNPQTWIQIAGDKAAEAWKAYKDLWKKDPLIAMYGTNQVIKMVAELLKEEEVKKEAGGLTYEELFGPGGMPRTSPTVAEVQSRYGRGPKAGPMGGRPSTMPAQPQVSRQYASPMSGQGQGLIGSRPQERLA